MKTRKTGSVLMMLIVMLVVSFFIVEKPVEAATEGFYEYRSEKDGTATITKYLSDEVNCVIPKTLGGAPIGQIGGSAFKGKTYMKTVKIPETVTKIDSYAFEKCQSLTSLTIPNSVTTLGYRMCAESPALKSVVIGSGVKEIPNGCFVDCTSLSSVSLPYGLEKILGSVGYYGSFAGCTALTSINIPSTVTIIKEMAFCRSGLTSIVIPDSVTEIGYKSFSECPNLKKAVVSANVKVITREAFSHSTALETVEIRGNKLDQIEYDSFSGCSSLSSINMPASLDKIGKYSFEGCVNLKTLKLNEGLGEIGDCVFWGSGLTELTIPKSVTRVGSRIFWDCKNLKSVNVLTNIDLNNADFMRLSGANPTVYCYSNSQYLDNLDECTLSKMTAFPATAVSVNPTQTGVYVGETTKIGYTITPSNSTDSVKYVSSNTKIATVNQHGIVTGVAKGSVTITVETNEGKVAQATVVVNQHPKSLTFSKDSVSMKVGESVSLPAKIDNGDRNDVAVNYKSSNTAVASVDAVGNVKAIAPGTATITASVYNGLIDTVTIKVAYGPVKKVSFSIKKKTMAVKQKATIKAKVDDGARTDVKITYKSSNTKVATVNSSGQVNAKKAGTAYITAMAGGKSAKIKITVKKAPSKIKFKKNSVTIARKKSTTLKYTLTKNTYTYKLTWKSSNKKIATVNSKGKVTGKKKGTCKITVKTHNGKKATIKVKVK